MITSGDRYVKSKLEIINDVGQIGVVKEEKRVTDEPKGLRSDLNTQLEDSLGLQSHRQQAKDHSKTNNENVIVLLIWESCFCKLSCRRRDRLPETDERLKAIQSSTPTHLLTREGEYE